MPFIDFNKNSIAELKNPFDYTIIGAGVAGILLALKLSEKNKRVLVIESGHFEEDEKRQELNRVENTAKIVENAIDGRKRAIGGTSIAWGGQSLPFTPLDFEKKEWLENTGWPIKYEDLEPFYPFANRFLGVDEWDYQGEIFQLFNYNPVSFKEDNFYQHFSKWAPEPNLKKLYYEQIKQSVTVVYNAVLTKIDLDSEGKAEKILIANFDKKQTYLPVKNILLATGGIETNRILLTNNHQVEGGIGNESGWLGKCYMDHPCIELGVVESPDIYKLQSTFNTHIHKKRKYSFRLSLTELAQKKYQLTNCSAMVEFRKFESDEENPYFGLVNLRNPRKLVDVKKIIKNYKSYFLTVKALVREKFVYKHKALPRITLMLEQEPTIESYIGLSEQKDIFGIPKAKIHWVISPKTWNTVIQMTTFLKSEFERLSLGNFIPFSHVNIDNPDWANYLTDVNHHIGGTRMSETPEQGVVDKNLRIWGHENIFVCSTSVFPTGSHSNPTLTLMALCVRLVSQFEHEY